MGTGEVREGGEGLQGLAVGGKRSAAEGHYTLPVGDHHQVVEAMVEMLLSMLDDLGADRAQFLDRRTHSLQTATRAFRDGRDEEYVVCALLHDVGEQMGPLNHGEIAASILHPFISDGNYWMLANHQYFQAYSFGSLVVADPAAEGGLRSNQYYERTVEFATKYDSVSFDPGYANEPLATFEPMVRRVLSRTWALQG